MPLTAVVGVKWRQPDDGLWANLALTHAARADKLSSGDRGDTQRIPPGGTPALHPGQSARRHEDQ